MVEEKRTAGRPWNSHKELIKNDAIVKTFKGLKGKASNRMEWKIEVVDKPMGWRKKN